MSRKIRITEGRLRDMVLEELTKTDVVKTIKDEVPNIVKKNKDLEKYIKNIAADAIKILFKTLWQKNNLYDADLRR